ncbi:MAG TPA: CDP-diacylglycerol--glycerol-3-phosphate 3-phosphatidyltransferase [Planctomycetota bacterium]|nr:CDP-diacylglycerol--glycerol-3-phosphate 3-phosphatidyltransferase [Planctomycetota bacterium]
MREGIFAHWPNRITAARFVGASALFVVFAQFGHIDAETVRSERAPMLWAFWLFIVVAASDVLDGWLARRGNHITAFGRIADPFVDKVLVVGAMIFLSVMPWSRQYFPAWIVVVILSREFLVTGIRGYVESLGEKFPADNFGKVKMVTQCIAVGIVLGMFAFEWTSETLAFLKQMAVVFVWVTLVTSVGSGLSYIAKTRKILAERVN